MSTPVFNRARPRGLNGRKRSRPDPEVELTSPIREEVCVRRTTLGPERLVAFLADRPAPDGFIESWEPGESCTSPASLDFYRDCVQIGNAEAQAWLRANAFEIPSDPTLDFAPGQFKALAAISKSRWKDIWGLGYDDDVGLERILRGTA